MSDLGEWVGQELKWVQPHALRMEYDLQAAGARLATLRFRSSLGSLATAECGAGCWTFKRVGFWQTKATIRECGAGRDLAVFRNNTWENGGTLVLADGRQYPANTNFWMTEFEFASEAGASLVQYLQIGGLLHLSARVLIQPAAADLAELPWLVALGCYLIVMLHQDSAAAAAA